MLRMKNDYIINVDNKNLAQVNLVKIHSLLLALNYVKKEHQNEIWNKRLFQRTSK